MQEIQLVELFSLHGIVNTVTVITDKETGEPKGYGFITMADVTGADRAIQALDGAEIDGRTISVRLAEEKKVVKPAIAASFSKAQQIKPGIPRRNNRTEPPRPKRPRRHL